MIGGIFAGNVEYLSCTPVLTVVRGVDIQCLLVSTIVNLSVEAQLVLACFSTNLLGNHRLVRARVNVCHTIRVCPALTIPAGRTGVAREVLTKVCRINQCSGVIDIDVVYPAGRSDCHWTCFLCIRLWIWHCNSDGGGLACRNGQRTVFISHVLTCNFSSDICQCNGTNVLSITNVLQCVNCSSVSRQSLTIDIVQTSCELNQRSSSYLHIAGEIVELQIITIEFKSNSSYRYVGNSSIIIGIWRCYWLIQICYRYFCCSKVIVSPCNSTVSSIANIQILIIRIIISCSLECCYIGCIGNCKRSKNQGRSWG